MTPYEHIVGELAHNVRGRLTAAIVRKLQRLTGEHLTSGQDSGLTNVWDEVCVQVQLERSFLWYAYEQTVRTLVERQVGELAPFELRGLTTDENWTELSLSLTVMTKSRHWASPSAMR